MKLNSYIVAAAATLLVTAALFLKILDTSSPPTVTNTEIPFVVTPFCDPSDIAVTLLEDSTTICRHDESLYTYISEKRTKIGAIEGVTATLPGSLGFFVGVFENRLAFYRISQALSVNEFYTLRFSAAAPPSTLLIARASNKIYLLLDAQKEATSPTSPKSVHYRLTVDTATGVDTSPVLAAYETTEMLRVADYHPSDAIIFFREMYPFLEEKYRIFVWKDTPRLLSSLTPPLGFVRSNIPQIIIQTEHGPELAQLNSDAANFVPVNSPITSTENSLEILRSANTIISYDLMTQELRWSEHSGQATPTTLLSYLPDAPTNLSARYSTTIDKKVYNCFDFSESLQITLRACLPAS